ncbi:hypothetical protein EUTSA_v10019693mg, partial [Eutrema salsugineum]
LKRILNDSKTACRKEKKEKKERRKHKKEKHEKSHKHSSSKADDVHKKQFFPSKKVSDESDQLERSDLTEELEGPQNQLGYLSDGSHNSKKRKLDDSPPAVESSIKAAPVAGNPLRIRFIFKKPKAEVSDPPREDLVCSTSVSKPVSHQDVVITSSVSCSKVSEPVENLPSTSSAAVAETKKRKKHKPSKEDRYNALFDDWTPPSSICFPTMEVDSSSKDDDDDWLFGNRAQEKLNRKALGEIDENMDMSLNRRGDSSWPRAQFLSEVGIYSLPYTVPF